MNVSIVTPERAIFNGEANGIIVRTIVGDVGILDGHAPYVSPLDVGALKLTLPDGTVRIAAVAGGLIKVSNAQTAILTNTCEWADEIDVERAKKAEQRARDYLKTPTQNHTIDVAEFKLKRALNRINLGMNGR